MRTLLVICAGVLTAIPSARAWEGVCRDTATAAAIQRADIEAAVCSHESVAACEGGLAYARGIQLGEHTWITRDAMTAIGLPGEVTTDRTVFRTPLFLPPIGTQLSTPTSYFGSPEAIVGTPFTSLAPALFGTDRIERRAAIPELSEVPDGSHSLSEYILGNEVCLPGNIPGATPADLDRCHGFRAHMSVINASHWAPLNRRFYGVYHDIALAIAERCKRMADAAPNSNTAMGPYMVELAASCEREALAFEAYAAHYLQDAMAAGHMFVRWGTVSYREPPVEQLQQSLASALVGIIHGARSITKLHDQLNMSGPGGIGAPFDADAGLDADDVERRHTSWWGYENPRPPVGAAPGAGDLYLLPCTQRSTGWAVSEGANLAALRSLMQTCVGRGFESVYNAGPMTFGALTPMPNEMRGDIAVATDPLCWEQRATNRSMWNGLGVAFDPDFLPEIAINPEDLADPGWWTNKKISVGADKITGNALEQRQLDIDEDDVEAESLRFRRIMGQLALLYARWGSRRPDDFQIAQMDPRMRVVLNGDKVHIGEIFPFAPSNDNFVDDVTQNRVPYVEDSTPDTWSHLPIPQTEGCDNDDDCAPHAGTYCGEALVDDLRVRACVPHEAAILHGFHGAEQPYWCSVQAWDEVNEAQARCVDENTVSCTQCVQRVLPRLRNACDPGAQGFPPPNALLDPRSVCDYYGEAGFNISGALLHRVYEPEGGESWQDAAVRTALEFCLEDPSAPQQNGIGYTNAMAPGPNTLDLTVLVDGFRIYSGLCGRVAGDLWYRFGHTAGNPNTDITFTLSSEELLNYPHTDSLDAFELHMFAGPACNPGAPIQTGVPIDTDGDLTNDALLLSWPVVQGVPAEVCVRVSATRGTTQTGIFLHAEAN